VDEPLRRLVLTTPAFFDIFTRRTIGAVSSDIAVVRVPLPPDIQAKVESVVRVASREVTPAAAAAAVASEIEPQLHDCSRIAPFPRATSSRTGAEPIREINSARRSGTGAGDPRLPLRANPRRCSTRPLAPGRYVQFPVAMASTLPGPT
jgi:hypothetical protein